MNAVLIIYALGTILDYLTTRFLMAYGGSEANPIMAAVILHLGIEWILIAKILALIYVWSKTKQFYKEMPRLTFYTTYFFICYSGLPLRITRFGFVLFLSWVYN